MPGHQGVGVTGVGETFPVPSPPPSLPAPHIPGQSQGLGTLWSEAAGGKEPANYTTNESLSAHPVSSGLLRP